MNLCSESTSDGRNSIFDGLSKMKWGHVSRRNNLGENSGLESPRGQKIKMETNRDLRKRHCSRWKCRVGSFCLEFANRGRDSGTASPTTNARRVASNLGGGRCGQGGPDSELKEFQLPHKKGLLNRGGACPSRSRVASHFLT